jgi:hypothetical protein
MSLTEKPAQRLLDLFQKKSCWMIEPLADELAYSIPSVRRFLAEAGYFSSFTHNGAWYTLSSIPRFDRDGLWFFHNIGFARTGSLTNILIDLTERSPAGMTAEQLGAKLSVRCHSVLVQLCRRNRLQRQKLGRSHIYFSVDPSTASLQRQSMTVRDSPVSQLPAELAVSILVRFIQKPESSFKDLAQVISRKMRVTINAAQIQRLFDQHGIKKTT